MMNQSNIQRNWQETRGKIKSRWTKLSDTAIDSVKDNLPLLKEQIQKTYGYSREQATREFNEFNSSIGTGSSQDDESSMPGNRFETDRDVNKKPKTGQTKSA